MKRLFLLLFAGAILSAPCVFAEDKEDDEEIPQTPPPTEDTTPPPPTNVPINPPIVPPNPEQLKPRSLSPISGLYVDGVVDIYFMTDMGTVSVTVLCTATGNMWCENGESRDGIISLAIGSAAGAYTVIIETQTAGTFSGQFAI